MQKLRYESILRRLGKEGFRFCEFSMVSEGDYAADDADWNYKDMPHLAVVHHQADSCPVVIGRDVTCTINLQKLFGIWMPVALMVYELKKNCKIYYTTLLFFVLVVQTEIEEKTPLRTTVTTTYNVGYPRWLFFMVPLLRWTIKRNYNVLMSEDLPMRDRRGELRKLGYRFRDGDSYGFVDTVNIYEKHVRIPAGAQTSFSANYQEALGTKDEATIGDAGLLGLRLSRQGDTVTVWPRTCPHEGASLDGSSCRNATLTCPWHGRSIQPIGTFTWNDSCELSNEDYGLRVVGETIHWHYTGNG